MATLGKLQQQIESLQKQASEIRAREFSKTIVEIKALMLAYGITIKDLQAKDAPKKAGGAKEKALTNGKVKQTSKRAPVQAKYRGPNGESWTGRGLTPKWLKELVAQGQNMDSYLIGNTSAPDTPL